MTDPQGPKIIVDSDWKSQAQAEKERMAAAERAKAPAAQAPGAGGPEAGMMGGEPEGPPQANFEELIRSLAMQALMYLGAFPDPESGRRMVGLEPAKFNIDLLAMLEEKTKNNLTELESKFLTQMLYELRLQYVDISKAVAKAVEQGKVQAVPGGGMMGGGLGGMAGGGEIPPMNIQGPGLR